MTTFRLLGPLEVEDGHHRLTFPGSRTRALLTALLMQPNGVVPVTHLVDALWGEEPPTGAVNALHQVVARLRAQLGSLGSCLVTRPPGYVFVTAAAAVDTEQFEAAYRAARGCSETDPARAADLLSGALSLWRGPAYAEFADGFARAAATRLEELRMAALADRAEVLLRTGAVSEAVARATELVTSDPMRERSTEVVMRALHADGRVGEALEAYRRYRELLADELGLDPSPALRQLEAQILREDLALPVVPVPPARDPSPAHPRELPWRPGPMLGRDRELRLLRECLTSNRLITLVGPGGVGKTRLALEALSLIADDGTPAWWADLTTVVPDRLVGALAEAVGVESGVGPEAAGVLVSALGAYRGLLCLDNAESVLEPLAPLVERLVAGAPDLTVLATSRERLAIAPEHVHLLTPLELPAGDDRDNPAVRLFLARAPGLEPDMITDDEVAVVAELCRRLDGLPLAIELGAAQTRAFGLGELAGRLSQGLDLLSGGRRTAAARHRTLRAVVDWSYALLTPQEALLFARLAVFPGGFTLDQVEAVCTDASLPAAALGPLLVRLVEQSLVQTGEGRCWLLETLRSYAAERLVVEDRQRRRAEHARDTATRLATYGSQLSGPEEPAAAAALAALSPDLHAAWEYAVEYDRPLAVQLAADIHGYAYLRQRRDLLEWGLTVAGWDLDHPRLPDALAGAAAAAWADGHFPEATALAERGVAAGGGLDSPAAAAAIMQRANLAMFVGHTEEAAALLRRVVALHRAAGDDIGALVEEVSVWQVRIYAGEAAAAAAALPKLVDRLRAAGSPSGLAWASYVYGEALAALGDVPGALAAYRAADAAGSRADSRLFVSLARTSSVALLAQHGDPAAALIECRRMMDLWEELGNRSTQLWLLASLAGLLVGIGREREAAPLAGAVVGARDSHFEIPQHTAALTAALSRLREHLGEEADSALAEGAALSHAAAVAYGRKMIHEALSGLGAAAPDPVPPHVGGG